MKTLIVLLAAIAIAISFNSCASRDDSDMQSDSHARHGHSH